MGENKKINQVLLYRFFQGETSLSEEMMIRQWQEASPENAKRLIEERKMFDALLVMGDEKVSTRHQFVVYNNVVRRILQVAAVVAVAIITSLLMKKSHEREYEEYAAIIQKITVPAGQRISLELPDGTVVWLNSLSTIEYSPFQLNSESRRVQLNGEAYFEVKTDKNRPFVVETSKGNIEVLGTKFYVEAYSEDSSFITSLIEGSVRIVAGDNSLCLKPNQKAFLDKENLVVSEISDYDIYRWREGLISFSNESFSGIMKKFEKYYGVNIEVENEQAYKTSYTGKFRQSDGISYALKVLQRDVNFKFERNEQDSIIYIK